ncbi:MAG: DUF3300 domain-containing protein [Chthoniobacterales bacterium]
MFFPCSGFAQQPALPSAAPTETGLPRLTPEALEQLFAPIALYPDALIALILPASTVPSDVVLANRYMAGNGDLSQLANQQWDDSVKSLVRYPDILKWMDQNLEWTTNAGEAFVSQPADVMNTIQKLRAQAKAAGNLVDTAQQKVIVESDEVIRIIPAQPEIIYVPVYDPVVVYYQTYSPAIGPFVTFGTGCAVGAWLNYDFDWRNRRFYHGNWRGWNNGGGNNNYNASVNTVNVVNINNNNVTQWQPNAEVVNRQVRFQGSAQQNARITNANAPAAQAVGQQRSFTNRRNVSSAPAAVNTVTDRTVRTSDAIPTQPVVTNSPNPAHYRQPVNSGNPTGTPTMPDNNTDTQNNTRRHGNRQRPSSDVAQPQPSIPVSVPAEVRQPQVSTPAPVNNNAVFSRERSQTYQSQPVPDRSSRQQAPVAPAQNPGTDSGNRGSRGQSQNLNPNRN